MNRTGPAALTLGALLLLASCSGEDADAEPRPRPTATSEATSASPTPTEPAPTMPAQANAPFPEGAPAFTKYYVDVLNHAARTGDSSRLKALSADECVGCTQYVENFDGPRVNATQPLWAMGNAVELEDTGDGLGVVAEIGALNDAGGRDMFKIAFVVSDDEPRRIVELYRIEK
ncbi:DUF6318 family protein [Aeromicrobium massiliense]|uniref:DUF6318 family protein n=1 Tax=Aeromicrobium massiliense TaxID=1464554 RepID=UPI000B070DEF|nr:DUF6318 family protein [Aeromicrobium massiliense]